jgi:hypothetical protein
LRPLSQVRYDYNIRGMETGINPGRMDWVLNFHYPTTSKDAIGSTIETLTELAGNYRAEKVTDASTEKFEAGQQVGIRTLTFRMRDFRRSFTPDYTWEFDAYPIGNVSLTKRFKVLGVRDEGRRNYILLTGEARNNG